MGIVYHDSVALTFERVERQGTIPPKADAVTKVCLAQETQFQALDEVQGEFRSLILFHAHTSLETLKPSPSVIVGVYFWILNI